MKNKSSALAIVNHPRRIHQLVWVNNPYWVNFYFIYLNENQYFYKYNSLTNQKSNYTIHKTTRILISFPISEFNNDSMNSLDK